MSVHHRASGHASGKSHAWKHKFGNLSLKFGLGRGPRSVCGTGQAMQSRGGVVPVLLIEVTAERAARGCESGAVGTRRPLLRQDTFEDQGDGR